MKNFKSYLNERCWPGYKETPGKKAYEKGSCTKEEVELQEGRPSQRHPLEGHAYHKKTDAELKYIAKDAHEAAESMKGHNEKAENKYRDQVNDASTVLHFRKTSGTPDWYKKKYGHMKEETDFVKEEVDQVDEALDFKKEATKHMKDMYDKNATPANKAYAQKMLQRALEASKMKDKMAATKHYMGEEIEQINELSTELLGRYKKAAGASASAADKAGDFEKGNKRFAGINKATLKQFKNFVKKEEVEQIEEGEGIVTPRKQYHGEPPPGTYAYERKYGKYTAKGTLRKRPNPNKPPVQPVKEDVEQIEEDTPAWQRKEGKSEEGGLNRKGIESYRRENPGSKLSMAVTTKPSKLKPGSKAANRRKSFCARMGGMKKRLTSAKTANDPDSRINKALRKWNC